MADGMRDSYRGYRFATPRDGGGRDGYGGGGATRLAEIFGTEKDRVNCPFYFKIGGTRARTPSLARALARAPPLTARSVLRARAQRAGTASGAAACTTARRSARRCCCRTCT